MRKSVLVVVFGSGFLLSSLSMSTAQVLPTQPIIPHSTLSGPVGPVFFGLKIGMSTADVQAAYGGIDQSGSIRTSPTYGKYIEMGHLPNENFVLIHRNIYSSAISNNRLYRIRVEIAKSLDGSLFSPDEAFESCYRYRNNLSQRFQATGVSEESPPTSVTECPGGSENARSLIDAYSQDGWNTASPNERAILAMHCGVIPYWRTKFGVAPGVTLTLSISPIGGGRFSDIVLNQQDIASEQLVMDFVKRRMGN